jgi:nitroreductase
MQRSFESSVELDVDLEALLTDSLRSPTAGNSRGVGWILLEGSEAVARYFAAATDAQWRQRSVRADGLQRASAAAVCVTNPSAYVERYAAADKRSSGLGEGPETWPVPYWIGDAGASVMSALLLSEEQGLAAAFLGAFRRDAELREALAIPDELVIYGTVLLGRSDEFDRRSASLDRLGPTRASLVRRDRWR